MTLFISPGNVRVYSPLKRQHHQFSSQRNKRPRLKELPPVPSDPCVSGPGDAPSVSLSFCLFYQRV